MSGKLKLIGRLSTEMYSTGDEFVYKRKFKILKRKSVGGIKDLIQDDHYDISRIDMSNLEDGIYQLTTRNESYDIESGYIDDYDIVLVKPVDENNKSDTTLYLKL